MSRKKRTVTKWIMKWGGAGVGLAVVFLIVGYVLHGNYQEQMSLYYEGERIEADARILADDEDTWLRVSFEHGGKKVQAEVDATRQEIEAVKDAPGALPEVLPPNLPPETIAQLRHRNQWSAQGKVEVVFWPSDIQAGEADPMTVGWLEAQKPSFVWAYYAALIVLLITLPVAIIGGMLRGREEATAARALAALRARTGSDAAAARVRADEAARTEEI